MQRRDFLAASAAAVAAGLTAVPALASPTPDREVIRVAFPMIPEKPVPGLFATVSYDARSAGKIIELVELYTQKLAWTGPDGKKYLACDYTQGAAELIRRNSSVQFNVDAWTECGDERLSHCQIFIRSANRLLWLHKDLKIEYQRAA